MILRALEPQARDCCLKEILLGAPQASKRATRQRVRLHPLAAKLIERGQAAGVVRDDATTQYLTPHALTATWL